MGKNKSIALWDFVSLAILLIVWSEPQTILTSQKSDISDVNLSWLWSYSIKLFVFWFP